MRRRLIVTPAEGRRVRRPDGRPLSATGELVVVDPYWSRRLAAGDVVGTPPASNRSADAVSASADVPADTSRPKSKRE